MSRRIHLDGALPVMNPVTGGVDCEAREVIYDRGDGSVREIALPDVIREVITPFEPTVEDPSRNVPAE